jgi:phosphate transport system substrate-binding protein
LERIFSAGDRSADGPAVRTWGELGLKGEWAARPIHLYGFTVDNDKAQIFRRLVFRKGEEWSPALRTFGNEGGTDAGELILRSVASDPDAIGISNIHYATAAVRALAIAPATDAAAVAPTRDNVASRHYPLTRAVYMVTDAAPRHPLSPAVREFLRYVLSREAQHDVAREGNYLPLPVQVALHERQRLAGR